MRLTWYGHSAFLVEASDGTRIIVDPYRPGAFGKELTYGPINETADAVLASHAHEDHGAVDTIPGHPLTAVHPRGLTVGTVSVAGVPTKHDEAGGQKRGENTVIILEADGLRVAHLGDLGHRLSADERKNIGAVDVLLIPVGGYFTIDADQAADVVNTLQPAVVVPMHFRNRSCSFPIAPVDDFLATQLRVVRAGSSVLDLDSTALPQQTTTYVLEPAR